MNIDYSDMEETARRLIDWIEYESYTYCKICHLLQPCKMLPNHGTGKIDHAKNYICAKGRYHVPIVIISKLSIAYIMKHAVIHTKIIVLMLIYMYSSVPNFKGRSNCKL